MLILVNKKPVDIEAAKRLTVIVHQPGIRVDVPEFVEINGRNTIDCMAKMNQKQWEWISTGDLFKELFNTAFCDDDNKIEIPKTIEELNDGDFGTIHICGIIVLGCEAIFENKKIFFREPETHLHPKIERTVVSMIMKMVKLAGDETTTVEVTP